MPVKSIVLPPNLCQEKKHAGKSIYKKDYCFRHRHGRRGKETKENYTSFIDKQQDIETDSFIMQLPDHYKKVRQNIHFPSTLGDIKQKPIMKRNLPIDNSVNKFFDKAPNSLKKIEEAWNQEVDTGKRERGNVYGLAGKKIELRSRKINDEVPLDEVPQVLPGLNDWLSTANEQEKRVVHTFISRLSEANRPTDLSRPHSSPAGKLFVSGNQLIKCKPATRKHSRFLAPTIAELRSTSIVPKPPPSADREVVPSPLQTPPRTQSPCVEAEQLVPPENGEEDGEEEAEEEKHKNEGNEGLTTPPAQETLKSEKVQISSKLGSVKVTPPQSPTVRFQRPWSTPASLSHNCNNCEPCKKKRLKKMIDQLSGTELSAYSELIVKKEDNVMNTMSTKMYRPIDHVTQLFDDDYFHHGSTFQNVKTRDKGYFTIHPQFVSENVVELKKLRKKHQKYFGESRVPLF